MKLTKEFKEKLEATHKDDKYDVIMAEYNRQHARCPKCNAEHHTTTLVAYMLYIDDPESYRDENSCDCAKCGDVHIAHDRVEKIIKTKD